jgi:hypothetical protein
MNIVSTGHARRILRRGAVTSRIRDFTLPQLGISEQPFLQRFAQVVRESPYDSYDPAIAAERLVVADLPEVYSRYEADWLKEWANLHEQSPAYQDGCRGVQFWIERIPAEHAVAQALSTIRPHRRRCCRRYLVAAGHKPYIWQVFDLGTPVFSQKVADVRARVRRFSAPPFRIIEDSDLQSLLGMICELVKCTPGPKPDRFTVTMHLMLTYARLTETQPAPEGVHQDGSNYIVSALVLERKNVVGGESFVLLNAKGPPAIVGIELEEGHGLLQSDIDHNLWHGVSSIRLCDPSKPGHRSILGLDIDYE